MEDRLSDLAAAEKVEVIGDPELDGQSRFQSFTGSVVEIETANGKRLVARRDAPRGSPGDPLTEDEIRRKFETNAAFVLSNDETLALRDQLDVLQALADVAPLARSLGPTRSSG